MDWSGGDGGFTDIVSRFHKGREIFLCHCEQILCHWETDLAPLAPVQSLWLVEFSTLFSKIMSCISVQVHLFCNLALIKSFLWFTIKPSKIFWPLPDEASFPSYIVRNQRPVMNQNVAILRKCASLLFTFTRLELVVGLLTHYNLGACPIKDVDFACTSLWKCGQCYFVPLKSATPLYLFFVLGWGYLTTHHNQNSFSTYDELFGPNWQSSGDDLFRNERWHILWICPELIRAQTRLNLLVTWTIPLS